MVLLTVVVCVEEPPQGFCFCWRWRSTSVTADPPDNSNLGYCIDITVAFFFTSKIHLKVLAIFYAGAVTDCYLTCLWKRTPPGGRPSVAIPTLLPMIVKYTNKLHHNLAATVNSGVFFLANVSDAHSVLLALLLDVATTELS